MAGQESRDCFDFISDDLGICGIYLSLALFTAKIKKNEINHVIFLLLDTAITVGDIIFISILCPNPYIGQSIQIVKHYDDSCKTKQNFALRLNIL